jgi:hypothetical protein
MAVVVDAPSIDAAVASPTVTAVLLLIKSIETLELLANNDACIEVTKSDDIIPECSRAVSTSVADNLSVIYSNRASFVSSNLDTSVQTSFLAKNSSVAMDLMSNNTAVTVGDKTAGSFESASITDSSRRQAMSCMKLGVCYK